MKKIDRSKLLPNKGYVWQEVMDADYLDHLIAYALMYGATWHDERPNKRQLIGKVHEQNAPSWSRDKKPVVLIDAVAMDYHSSCITYWVQIINYDEFLTTIETERKDYEQWEKGNTRVGRNDR